VRAEGQAKAIETVFSAIHAGDPDPKLLAYQYLQMLPQIAQGDSNKVWMIPSEFSHALERFQERFTADTNGKAPIPPITKHLAGER
jgi:regulator of protease activity HflC (stomatin/prohibitin superfamily)